ncbi:hypothetical protein SCB71_03515 [Herbiconiux sp. KACC 21604]|uniref:hypothetical protein n=1 Tax=unclassified Herbiconiux TaxID=2618217 RepID=UPI0014922AB3|nr:hypothetical protein [Herbiconiux sp. SALV-R1]QJU52451.1 hypothetical protein HL652_01485 [Herbiconiux sp. SALV-R1]WPO87319.1 hypothetical protein SCB71_03515 [Herbiconiux sp. KACC 21604]
MLIAQSQPAAPASRQALVSLVFAIAAPVLATAIALLGFVVPAGDTRASITFGPAAVVMLVEVCAIVALVSISAVNAVRALREGAARRLLPIVALCIDALTLVLWFAPLEAAFVTAGIAVS